ncbi:energy-coupling factor transporter transmembrane protein EcfT [Aquihabitans sp. G128]|uniref:energy-coupling factor transporter transmembrane component T family protein n=1 Tax=Aquihabitans sp. G128 TaxID=2849779 RepID=UPI001C23D089|nr:energy-coupling factor transporter transmembrane component T [Aquihabitans sp. G128]QXC59178.1 energy-coupling factor transporter transmembrane protein EcfT [Aquihabitans sp. G128]
MSSAHGAQPAGERLESPLTRLAPEVKVVALVAFLVAVALTPPQRPWAFAAHAAVVLTVAVVALVPLRTLATRLVFEIPVLALAATYAAFGRAPRVEVLAGLTLSRPGLVVAFGVLAKATIGVVAVSVVAASTTATELVRGLARLRVPTWFCDLVALSARQVEVLRAEAARVRLAAELRGGPGRIDTWRAVARSLGTLFVQGAARAERLATSVAVRSGGGDGPLVLAPAGGAASPVATSRQWAVASVPALLAAAALLAGVLR